jgi:S1-C subfamily serine protease
VQGSPAAEAGLRQGDMVTALGEEAVASTEDLVAAIATREPGETVTLEVERDGQKSSLKVTLGTQPAESGAVSPSGE